MDNGSSLLAIGCCGSLLSTGLEHLHKVSKADKKNDLPQKITSNAVVLHGKREDWWSTTLNNVFGSTITDLILPQNGETAVSYGRDYFTTVLSLCTTVSGVMLGVAVPATAENEIDREKLTVMVLAFVELAKLLSRKSDEVIESLSYWFKSYDTLEREARYLWEELDDQVNELIESYHKIDRRCLNPKNDHERSKCIDIMIELDSKLRLAKSNRKRAAHAYQEIQTRMILASSSWSWSSSSSWSWSSWWSSWWWWWSSSSSSSSLPESQPPSSLPS